MLEMTAELYRSVVPLIHNVIHKIQTKYGGDCEDMLSLAHECFVEACQNYDAQRGAKFSSRFQAIFTQELIDAWRRERRYVKLKTALGGLVHREPFNFPRLLSEVSRDARKVMRMVVDQPKGTVRGQGRVSQVQNWLVGTLKRLGWSSKRIVETLSEVREALRQA